MSDLLGCLRDEKSPNNLVQKFPLFLPCSERRNEKEIGMREQTHVQIKQGDGNVQAATSIAPPAPRPPSPACITQSPGAVPPSDQQTLRPLRASKDSTCS